MEILLDIIKNIYEIFTWVRQAKTKIIFSIQLKEKLYWGLAILEQNIFITK
jgi:hypothetical protein